MTRSAMDATDALDYQRAEAKMREDAFRLVELLKANVLRPIAKEVDAGHLAVSSGHPLICHLGV